MLSLFGTNLFAQETIEFKAFGHIPQNIGDSLYYDLNHTQDPNSKLKILYLITNEHLKHGNADSVLQYAKSISNLTLKDSSRIRNSLLYRIRAYRLAGNANFINGLNEEALKSYIDGL